MYYNDYPYCWPFIIGAFFIVVIGRYFGIVCSYYMFNCAKGSDNNILSFREISFATYAAFIRGAIAFGLVEMLDEHTFHYKRVIVSSTMVLVISTTCIFGGFTPIVLNFLLPSKKIDVMNVDALTSNAGSDSKEYREHGSANTDNNKVENIFSNKEFEDKKRVKNGTVDQTSAMLFSGKEDVAGSFGNSKFNLPDNVKKVLPELSPK